MTIFIDATMKCYSKNCEKCGAAKGAVIFQKLEQMDNNIAYEQDIKSMIMRYEMNENDNKGIFL